MKYALIPGLLTALLIAPVLRIQAQDIHFTQVDAAPLAVNPALTGNFNGGLRASAIYMNQWAYTAVPYISYGAGIDLPIYVTRHGDYIAGGIQVTDDRAGDGNVINFSAVASAAFHKSFALFSKEGKRNSDLSLGLQAGYGQSVISLYNIYAVYNGFIPATGGYPLGVGTPQSYYAVNTGISFSQALSPRLNYIIGIAGYNLNQPSLPEINRYYEQNLFSIRYTITAGANWQTTEKLTLRPLAYYQLLQSGNELIAGNEFNFAVSKQHKHTSLFFGIYYQTEGAFSATAGSEFHAFRLGVCYVRYTHPDSETGSDGSGRLEVAARYILPHKSKRLIPCNRL